MNPQDPKFQNLLNAAFELAKTYDTTHQEVCGPFHTIPPGYETVGLIQDGAFTNEDVAKMISAVEERAKQEDIKQAGTAFLKMFVTLLYTGIKVAGVV